MTFERAMQIAAQTAEDHSEHDRTTEQDALVTLYLALLGDEDNA